MNRKDKFWQNTCVALSILYLTGLLLDGFATPDPQDVFLEQYCDMVYLFQRSNGTAGWPDYKDNYNELCTEGKVK